MHKLLSYLLLIFLSTTLNATDISEKISLAIKAGDAKELCSFFNSTVELTVVDKEDIYSKAQAEVILSEFFKKNIVTNFELVHKGGNDLTSYFIGNMVTKTKKFRVYFLLKKDKDENLVHQLQIDLVN